MELLVLSGLSGSGKTTALRALEDMGFFCVDNLPAPLLSTLLRLFEESPSAQRCAVVMDIRESLLGPHVTAGIDEAIAAGYEPKMVFFDASDALLIRRFKETRRRHPLVTRGEAQTTREAITLEREWLKPMRVRASVVIDTSQMTVHELKRRTRAMFEDKDSPQMALHLMSFGFRYGIPPEANFVLDVRFIPNPYFVKELKEGTGLDQDVSQYVLQQDASEMILAHSKRLIDDVIPLAKEEGKSSMTFAVGCTGGRHRSVALIEALAVKLRDQEIDALVTHRDVEK